MWNGIRLQLCGWYIFIYVSFNIMALFVAVFQQHYNIADSRSEKTAVKQLNTKHVPCTAVWYKDREARREMHSGDMDYSNVLSLWQRSLCIW
jgi:hypothetical protein